MAFSATYTPELLADLEPLMTRPQNIMLCDEQARAPGRAWLQSPAGVRTLALPAPPPLPPTRAAPSPSGLAVQVGGVSLAGVRQFYQLLDDPRGPAPQQAAQPAADASAAAGADAACPATPPPPAGAGEQLPASGPSPQKEAPAAAAVGSMLAGGGQPALSAEQEQALLSAKVSALLELLGSASFHQVGGWAG